MLLRRNVGVVLRGLYLNRLAYPTLLVLLTYDRKTHHSIRTRNKKKVTCVVSQILCVEDLNVVSQNIDCWTLDSHILHTSVPLASARFLARWWLEQ